MITLLRLCIYALGNPHGFEPNTGFEARRDVDLGFEEIQLAYARQLPLISALLRSLVKGSKPTQKEKVFWLLFYVCLFFFWLCFLLSPPPPPRDLRICNPKSLNSSYTL